jgi:hypothetical protein
LLGGVAQELAGCVRSTRRAREKSRADQDECEAGEQDEHTPGPLPHGHTIGDRRSGG